MRRGWLYAWVFFLLATVAGADEPQPRETPLTPDEELATFQLADKRLHVDLVAAEPQVDSPVAICWDGDARMYVAEMIDYPTGPPAGRVRLLEDRDNDGLYEHATTFASGLNFPNGVLAVRGGLLVTAAPDLLFLKDTDGDGVADTRKVVFTGFGEGNQQLRANGLTWGLDNWIYGANGRSDGAIRRPDEPAEKAISLRGHDFRFSPGGKRFEPTSGQSQFGQTHDDWGNRFLSWNTIPIRHALFDQSFVDRNPRLALAAVRDIADPADTGQIFPVSPRPQTFNRERTDFYNALAGLTVYRGDALGRDYQDSAFAGETLTNLVHRRALMPAGPTFVSRRGEHDREFLAATDPWFHPVYLTTGPDGALYIVDFYRRWVEHPAFVAEALRGDVDWRQGAGHGRIWKVSRRENTWPPRPQPRLNRAPAPELIKQLESPNGWRRDTAHRLLVERRDPQTAPLLRAVLNDGKLPQAKVHALAILDALGALDDSLLVRGLEDGEPHVRQFALRLSAARIAQSSTLQEAVLTMTDFPSPLVRFEVARTMAALEGEKKVAALVRLAELETRDEPISLAVIGSLGTSASAFLARLVDEYPDWRRKPTPDQMRVLREAAAVVIGAGSSDQLRATFQLISPKQPADVAPGDLAILVGLAQALTERGHALPAMVNAPPEGLKPYVPALKNLIAAARTMAAAQNESLDHRLEAIEALGLLDSGCGEILLGLVGPEHDPSLQLAAAAGLAHASAETAKRMFASWNATTIPTRRALVAAALRSPLTVTALVDAIEAGEILPRELDPTTRDALMAVRDAALQPRIKKLLESEAAGRNRDEVIARYSAALEMDGDRQRGAAVFEKHCLTCHTVQTRGQRVGPDLSGAGAKARETVLVDVFDPSKQVAPEYVAYTLLTREGQVMSGVLVSETPTSVTLRRAEGAQDFVLREQIEELRSTGKSLMPDGMEENLSEADVADLLAFLAQPNAQLFSKPK